MQCNAINGDAASVERLARRRHRHRAGRVARLRLRGETVGADDTNHSLGHPVLGVRKGVELDRHRVVEVDKSIVVAGDIGLDLKRGIGRHQGDELLARLHDRAHRYLGQRLHDGIVPAAQLHQLSAQLRLVQLLPELIGFPARFREPLRDLRLPASDIRVAFRHQGCLVEFASFCQLLGIGHGALHLHTRIHGQERVELAAGLKRLELLAHLLDALRDTEPFAVRGGIGARARHHGRKLVDTMAVVVDLGVELGLAMPEDRRLLHPIGIRSRVRECLAVGLRLQACDLRLEARYLGFERGSVGGGEGGVEPCQELARSHPLPLAHVDGAHDRGFQRLDQNRRRFRDHNASCGHDLVDGDQPHRGDQNQDHARDHPDDALR